MFYARLLHAQAGRLRWLRLRYGTVAGALGDHLLIGPPLVITAGQVDDLVATLAEAIASVEKAVGI